MALECKKGVLQSGTQSGQNCLNDPLGQYQKKGNHKQDTIRTTLLNL